MQALEKSHGGAKHVDDSNDMHNSIGGVNLHETYLVPPSSFHDEEAMLNPPNDPVNSNHYETITGLSEGNTSLLHTDFNQEPPSEYTILSPKEASVNNPSQYQKLMVRSETSAYTLLQVVHKLDENAIHEGCGVTVGVDEASHNKSGVEGDGTVNNYATLLAATKKDDNEYASLTIRP